MKIKNFLYHVISQSPLGNTFLFYKKTIKQLLIKCNITVKALCYSRISGKPQKIAIICHLYFDDLLNEYMSYLQKIPIPYDLYITCSKKSLPKISKATKMLNKNTQHISIFTIANRGRDFYPFITVLLPRIVDTYPVACWIHTKKSNHDERLQLWRKYLLENLLGSKNTILSILWEFMYNRHLGLLFPKNYPLVNTAKNNSWAKNTYWGNWLKRKLKIQNKKKAIIFPAGNMFWFRPNALRKLLEIGITSKHFAPGLGKTNSELPHALERITVELAHSEGYSFKQIQYYP